MIWVSGRRHYFFAGVFSADKVEGRRDGGFEIGK